MNTLRDKKKNFNMTIAPIDGHKLTTKEQDVISKNISVHHAKRSPERLIRNQMLSVLYRLEEYLQREI